MAKSPSHPEPGRYAIDTGVAELAPDPIAGGWLLTVNGAQSSHIHPDDPTALDFEYLRQMAAVIEDRYPARGDAGNTVDSTRLRVLHLGGAACALARHLDHRYREARQVAVEIDGELARLVREWFDLPRAPRLRIRVGDAREVVTSLQPGTREVVVRDAFTDDRAPRHLTTVEFTEAVRTVLVPGGIYLANCGDNRDLALARSEAATVASVFEHCALIADPAMFKGRRTGNVVIVGSDAELDPSPALVRKLLSDPLPAHVLAGDRARSFARGPVLRDDASRET